MKNQSRLSILVTLSLVVLIATMGLANAQPQPIGTTLQPNPWESNPATPTDNTMYGVMAAASMRDGRITTEGYFQIGDNDYFDDTWVEFTGFDAPAATFTITWVDIKVNFQVDPGLIDDTWRIEWTVGGQPWTDLISDRVAEQFDPDAGAGQTVAFTQKTEPNDGVWAWADIAALKVRFFTTAGADGFSDFGLMHIKEVWATVYGSPLPLAGGGGGGGAAGLSVQPTTVASFGAVANRRFFIDIYVQGVTQLSGYQFTVNFDTTYLNPLAGGWSYYPFNYKAAEDLNDALGYVTMSYVIPTADPLVSTGVSGNFPIARIYFITTLGIPADWYSYLTFSVSLLSAPGAIRIVHMEYDGIYGTPPANTYMFSWIPASEFDPLAPVSSNWVEVYPDAGAKWHLTSWEDQGTDLLDPSDQIDMTPTDPPGPVQWFHVEQISEVNADPNINTHMIATLKEEVPEFPMGLGILMAVAPLIAVVYIWQRRKRSR